jgi:hypothetical protein
VRYGLEPEVAVYVVFEGGIVARVYAESAEDQERMLADLEGRADLLGEVAEAIDSLLIELRRRREDAA